ncbi:Protein of unknown function DUF3189 [Moorella glycerini]|uniref:DUF3189 domain-containing protein n=1 Tax=Neomoorella stamsii TaxID=1266720 RepID=A0A9X7P6F2_9FIRM|nr:MULTISPECIES: DUF3189 family protein [Moorella]PRR73025.1 hypothetical protein MOST_15710 [Moorella stamsii]CEP67696.1 Protein of unknown function DUF3189 [Moorella glycerini]
MIIIYACFSGTHAAVIAAALHLNWLSTEQLPGWQQVKKLPHFDVPEGKGGLRYMGHTHAGHAVYTATVGHDGEAARRAVETFLVALGRNQGEVLWIDVSPQVSFLWRAGAFCRRYRRLAWLGRLLLQWSMGRDYSVLVNLVKKALQQELNTATKTSSQA